MKFPSIRLTEKASHYAAATLFAAIMATPQPARADALSEAREAIAGATNAELKAEIERRSEQSGPAPKTAGPKTSSRGSGTDLSDIETRNMVKALRSDPSRPRAIYGPDDRVDWGSMPEQIKPLARASVALFNASALEDDGNGGFRLITSTLAEDWKLCPDEDFETQRTGAYCSGTLVAPDLVLTAGHCVGDITRLLGSPYARSIRFVFGFHADDADSPGATTIKAENVFSGTNITGGTYTRTGADWAVVKLSRPVPASLAKPVMGWAANPVARNQKVFVIGYPSGLPIKYAPGSNVKKTDASTHFIANLDTFGGNSGSGVFDDETHELVGVLVRGAADYVPEKVQPGECRIANVCPRTPTGINCQGEHVMRISGVSKP